jgi:hypothetical protein
MSGSVGAAFDSAGDYSRAGYTEALERVLDAGGKVSLMFGDRDVVSRDDEMLLLALTFSTRLAPGQAVTLPRSS